MQTVSMEARPALRDDVRCLLIVGTCSIVNLLVGFNDLSFNLGLMYGVLGLFLTRFYYRKLVQRKSSIAGIYPAVMGILIPLLTIAILFLIRGREPSFCVGMFLSVAFYNGLYLAMSKKLR
jgi:hypothetical protein